MSIEVKNISKTFGGAPAVDNVSLRINTGELVALLGPSGCGKTTLLRMIAGLEAPDPSSGGVFFHDEDVTSHDVGARGVGFVFQHYALFRHMSVFDNVAFGLKVRPRKLRPAKSDIRARVMELLRLVQLDNMARRYPSQLSGGQRQRVALARALAVEPKVLLLDEPFGALDAKVRKELRRWLRRLHDEVHITSVFVTHDQEEALEVADRVAVMNGGRIEQIGTPEDVYEKPASPFVYQFLGNVNLFHARMEGGKLVPLADAAVAASARAQSSQLAARPTQKGIVFVRPHDVLVMREPTEGAIPVTLEHLAFAGPVVRATLRPTDGSDPIEAELTRERYKELALKPDEQLYANMRNARVFDDYSI